MLLYNHTPNETQRIWLWRVDFPQMAIEQYPQEKKGTEKLFIEKKKCTSPMACNYDLIPDGNSDLDEIQLA